MNVLVVMAHPDDAEISIAGTLLKHISKGEQVHIICATAGERLAQGRDKETIEAARKMGAAVYFLHLHDTGVPFDIRTITMIESHIKTLKPYRMYIQSPKDTHQDHQNISKSALAAGKHVPQILMYASEPMTISFNPTYFVDITHFIDKKMEIVRCHKTMFDLKKMYVQEEVIKGQAFFRGSQIDRQYAECFEVFKYIQVD